MKESSRRSFFPIVLMTIGVVLILGAVAMIFLLRGDQTQAVVAPQAGEESSPDIRRVTLEQAKAAFDSGDAVFVDVRGAEYFSARHIPTARSIPLNELEARMGELHPEDWIILYCT